MNRSLVICFVLLLGGNALLWSGLRDAERSGAEERLRGALADVFGGTMVESRFPDHELMPADYVLMIQRSADAPLLSIYAASFPRDGLGLVRAHDPGACYANAGWSLENREDIRVTVDEARQAVLEVYRFGRPEEQRVVVSWKQPMGRVVDIGRPWWQDGLDKLASGRQDFVWVRVEVVPRTWSDDRPRLIAILAETMLAIETRFNRV